MSNFVSVYVSIKTGGVARCTCRIKSRITMAKAEFDKKKKEEEEEEEKKKKKKKKKKQKKRKKTLFTSKLGLNLRKKLLKC